MQDYTADPLEEAMRSRDYRHIGRNVERTVRHAMRSGDFGEAGRALQNGIQELTNDVNSTINGLRNAGRRYSDPQYWSQTGVFHGGPGGFQARYAEARSAGHASGTHSAFRSRMPGSLSGIFCAFSGFLLGFLFLFSTVAAVAVTATGNLPVAEGIVTIAVVSVLTVLSFILAGYGIMLRRRARRFARYRDALGGAVFCMVEKLAETVGESIERTRKDLRKMISTGACPQGHLDRKETCFMVDDETYEDYLEAEKAYAAREANAQAEKEKEQADPKGAELAAVRKEGDAYLRQIRAVNDALPGEEISEKLDKLETVTGRIFDCVERHPEKLPEIHRFMQYYLPTTLKLVKAYEEFEKQPLQGENITQTKKEIRQALDTINTAFGNLLDTLYENDAFDISTDISTLETMLRQEGLTGSDFEKPPEDGKHI